MDEEFKNRIINLYGDGGQNWLESIPSLIGKYEKEWNIKTLTPFKLSYNYVCPARTSGNEEAVLKLSFPKNKEFTSEIEALKRLPTEVAIKIINEDLPEGAVLLERAVPGNPISSIQPDETQLHIASQVIKKLHQLASLEMLALFPNISDWAKAFGRYENTFSLNSGPIPKNLFDLGEGIFREFLQENKEQVLLHGDLHNDNILLSDRGWLAIDPKGLIGEREFELGAYLRNPFFDIPKGSNYKQVEKNRIAQFCEELGFEKERVKLWAIASAVISLIWFVEDENNFKEIYVKNAELINEIKF